MSEGPDRLETRRTGIFALGQRSSALSQTRFKSGSLKRTVSFLRDSRFPATLFAHPLVPSRSPSRFPLSFQAPSCRKREVARETNRGAVPVKRDNNTREEDTIPWIEREREATRHTHTPRASITGYVRNRTGRAVTASADRLASASTEMPEYGRARTNRIEV